VPVLLPASSSAVLAPLLRTDAECCVWWATPVECQSALFRVNREGRLAASLLDQGLRRLRDLMDDVDVVAPTAHVRERAGRLLRTHALRAADALQLAAALAWCDDRPAGATFVCLDERLSQAARGEGFTIAPA